MMCPTMDYHKTLWTLALANNSLKEKNNQLDTLVYIKPKKKH